MKFFLCLFAIVACANASLLVGPALSTGTSTQTRTQDAAGNYAFAYNEQHATGGSSRSESGNPLGTVGTYTLNVADGRQRVVKYVADGLGFRAAIATNEPGTAAKAPANVAISSPGLVAPAPVAVAAPAPIAVAAPAPIAYPGPIAAPVAASYPAFAVAPAPIAIAPSVSAYSSVVNHAAPIAAPIVARPAFPALAAPLPAARLW